MFKFLNIKPHWLRSGILAILIVTFLILITGLVVSISSGGECTEICTTDECAKSFKICFLYPLIISAIPVIWINSIINLRIGTNMVATFIMMSLPFYFFIGILISNIYKKFKKQTKKN